MSKPIYLQQNCKDTKKVIKEYCPNATEIKFGHNNICKGYWFQDPRKTCRSFVPLLHTVKV